MKKLTSFITSILVSLITFLPVKGQDVADSKIIVAYVTSWSQTMPDPAFMTHINYAFGHVNDTFDGIRIDNEDRLKSIVALKKQKPVLKVMLSVGGWGSGRFSEMAADDNLRKKFADDCQRVIQSFGLDGVDIDWEYPTSSAAGISASPDDSDNFIKLMRDIRQAIGTGKLLTMASVATAQFLDFVAVHPYMDFINIMAYDMSTPPHHHSPLYRSPLAGRTTADEAVKAHLEVGIPINKLVLGMPFYGRGGVDLPSFVDYKKIITQEEFTTKWDDEAKVPYLLNKDSVMVCTYDNPESLTLKCKYILDNNLLGGMYWDYDGDTEDGVLRKTVFDNLIGKP